MVIVDECHHAASATVVGILREVKAKYIYGVTATPMRGDGLEKITYRMIGPVRYSYGARDMAKEQGIRHFVYPRFTRTVSPHRLGEQMHVNDAYKLIRDNDMRNEQIAADVKLCIEKGRSPVVLSKYKEHAKLLYERLRQYADRAFLLLGDNPKKEQKKLMEELRQAGFQVRLVDDSCEHYTIIDREIVWYGSVNFLSKEDAEDNLMRVCSGKIADELLEMTFGGEESPEVW